jgi:GntR family transcriptional regulator
MPLYLFRRTAAPEKPDNRMSPRRRRDQPYKYQRVAADLQQIAAGLADGERLPLTLDELAQRHGVSAAVALQAAREIEAAGLIEVRHGAGMFARKFTPLLRHGSRRLSRDQWESGPGIQAADAENRAREVDRIEVTQEQQAPPVAAALGVGPVVVRRRRYLIDGRPVQLATSWLPASIAAGTRIAEPDTGPGGVYARLTELGHAPARFWEEITARMPLPAEREALALPRGRPVLEITRRAITAEGRTVEITVMLLDAAAYVLDYDIQT